ncbi:tRNA lysidine(34) synthetase TilS [Elusimicrobiota bacterium]
MSNRLEHIIINSIDLIYPLIICVSGGKDSISMFHLVMKFWDKFTVIPEVVHFNHGLREESEKEADFIKELCKNFGVPCNIFNLEVSRFAKENKYSIEEAARILRYDKLEEFTASKDYKGVIFTAHNANDQVETVIWRIVKGAGRTGLEGIRRERPLRSGWIIRRPLLDATSKELMDYVDENNLEFCFDKSNDNLGIPRNFIRHKVIPVLEELNPSLAGTVIKESSIWADEEAFLNDLVNKEIENIKVQNNPERICIELSSIMSYNKWLKRRILKKLAPSELDFNKTEALAGLIYANGVKTVIDIGRGWKARKSFNELIFEKETPSEAYFEYGMVPGEPVFIKEIGKTVESRIIEKKIEDIPSGDTAVFDAGGLDLDKIRIRSRNDGDKIRLWGSGGTKKIKDMCMDLKLSLEDRNNIALITHGDDILWAPPYRRSDMAPVTDKTIKTLELKIL